VLLSCSSVSYRVAPPPDVPGASFVGNRVCYDCHTNITRSFPSSPHARMHQPGAPRSGETGCESCHGPGSRHVGAGGGRGVFVVNPRRDPQACYACHAETHAEFALPRHHPLPEGKINCVDCHDPHGRDIFQPRGGLAMSRGNETCASCHRDQARPFAFVHEALREGCTACHQPHGSINDKMLVHRDNNLCLRCHNQLGSNLAFFEGDLILGQSIHSGAFGMKVEQASCWSAGCHSAVHGSNIDPLMRF
jgi:predicted CXXCH cytochrome family protein